MSNASMLAAYARLGMEPVYCGCGCLYILQPGSGRRYKVGHTPPKASKPRYRVISGDTPEEPGIYKVQWYDDGEWQQFKFEVY